MSEQFNEFGPFAVGEIVRCHGLVQHAADNGKWAKILSGEHDFISVFTGLSYPDWYWVELDGAEYLVRRVNLRRPRPPANSNERMHMQMWRDMADKAPQRVGATV